MYSKESRACMVQQYLWLWCTVCRVLCTHITSHDTRLRVIIFMYQHVVFFCEVPAVVNRVWSLTPQLWAGSWMKASRVSDPLPSPTSLPTKSIFFFLRCRKDYQHTTHHTLKPLAFYLFHDLNSSIGFLCSFRFSSFGAFVTFHLL